MVDFDSSEGKHPASPQSGFLVVRLAGDLHQLIAGLQHLHSRRVLHSDIKAPGRKYGMGWWLWRKDFVAKQLKMVWYYILGSWWFLFTAFFFHHDWLFSWRRLMLPSNLKIASSGIQRFCSWIQGWTSPPVLTGDHLGIFFPLFKAFPPTVWGSSRPPWVFYAPPEHFMYLFMGIGYPWHPWPRLNEEVSWWEIS